MLNELPLGWSTILCQPLLICNACLVSLIWLSYTPTASLKEGVFESSSNLWDGQRQSASVSLVRRTE